MTRIPSEFQIKSSDATTRVPVPVFETSSHESLCRFSSSPPIPYIYQVEPIDPKTKSWKRKENQSDRIGSDRNILFYFIFDSSLQFYQVPLVTNREGLNTVDDDLYLIFHCVAVVRVICASALLLC